MDIKGIVSIIAVTAAVFAGVWGIGTLVKKAPAHILKYVNWVISAVAFVSGLASYATGEAAYFYLFLICLVGYFLTISFKAEPEEK